MDRRSKSEQENQSSPEAVQRAANLIRSARNGLALTGAGISTPSGIPDFRSADSGLWSRSDPMEVASLSAFRHAPDRFYEWMRPLAELIFQAEPNPAHHALARLESAGHLQTIITQNIDGLHQRAGSSRVLEVHGTLETLTCVSCYRLVQSNQVTGAYLASGKTPRCNHCQSILKPNVILLGEQLPYDIWREAEAASRSCDLMIVIGSSLEVMPVAGLPLVAVERQVPLIMVNYTPTYIDVRADVVINDDLAVLIPSIVEETLAPDG